nr:uncharacterized protein K02A2.6-like [Rhipicephalus microplus]
MGLDAIRALKIIIKDETLTCSLVDSSVVPANAPPEYHHLFSSDIGTVRNYIHRVKHQPGVQPVAVKLRRLPFLLRQQVAVELQRLETIGIIERVDATDWVSPLVVVLKKDNSTRLCVNLREPNKAIVVDGLSLPHIEELLQQLTANRTREVQIPDEGNAWVQIKVLVLRNVPRPHLPVSGTEKAHYIPFQIPV